MIVNRGHYSCHKINNNPIDEFGSSRLFNRCCIACAVALSAFLSWQFAKVPGEQNHAGDDDKDDRQHSTKIAAKKKIKIRLSPKMAAKFVVITKVL
jgi:hypothetical protein